MSTKIVDVTNEAARPALPKSQAVLHVEWIDPDTKRTQAGEFTIKRLTLGDYSQVAIKRAQLSGGMPEASLDEGTRLLNGVLAHLSVAITNAPAWWIPENFYDPTILYAIHKEVMAFEKTFRDAVARNEPPTITSDSAQQSQGA